MRNKSKRHFIMIAIVLSGMIVAGGCAKRVSTSETGEAVKPGAEVSKPAAPVTVTEPPVPRVESVQEAALKGVPVKAPAPAKAIGDIYFDFDRYVIREDALATLSDNAAVLKRKAFTKLVIEGHCDERGTTDYNLALGERRAEFTKRYLTTLGIHPSKISIVSFGKEKPFCSEHNEDCWQQNRRAHFVVTE